MVAWPVLNAVASGLFTQIVISTDNQEIAAAAVGAGAAFHGRRPAELSDDHSTTGDVLRYELEQFEQRERSLPSACCCLYGTSFFASPKLLQEAYLQLTAGPSELVMGVCEYAHPVERALAMNENGELRYKQPECVSVRTQDIPPSFYDAGLFYWFLPERFLDSGGNSFRPLRKSGILVSRADAIDIDTEEDWVIAEHIAASRPGFRVCERPCP
jgi:N-acylneuraminate cytidylyltransferase